MMSLQYGIQAKEGQTGEDMSQTCAQELEAYLRPWSERLDAYVDRRIVGTRLSTVAGIVQTRSALTLTELGSTITGPQHADAGTQRLSRLRHASGLAGQPARTGAVGTSGALPPRTGAGRGDAVVYLG